MTTPAWDVFISYASEDEAYAQRLAQALTSRGMSVWLFSNVVLLGEKLVSKIDDGIRRSRHSILVLSPEYLTKVYTKAEFDAIIKRAVDNRGGSIIPLLHRGLSQTDLSSFSAFVSELRNMSTAEPFENVVQIYRELWPRRPLRSRRRQQHSRWRCAPIVPSLVNPSMRCKTTYDCMHLGLACTLETPLFAKTSWGIPQ